MNFIDEALISIAAGNGGDGCLSFRREKNIPKGGPDGGNGGPGGNLIFKSTSRLNTLSLFRYKKLFTAQHGGKGLSRDKTGKSGQDLIIEVPQGTMVFDLELDEQIADLRSEGEDFLIAKGGEGGIGNSAYKTSTNRAPTRTSKGSKGEYREVRLELRLLADVGLLGFPNAGKSSLVNVVSSAKPKIADYPFTTLRPSLGVVDFSPDGNFVIADIPGLISGASEGVGLGIQFLRHLSRTRLILQLIDIFEKDIDIIVKEMDDLVLELENYQLDLAKRERWLILNKIDLITKDQQDLIKTASQLRLGDSTIVKMISTVTKEGVSDLVDEVGRYLELHND